VVVGLFTVWVFAIYLSVLVAKERVPVELPFAFYVESVEGYVQAGGTWTIEGDQQAFPLQTTEIDCWQPSRTCTSGTAQVSARDVLTVNIGRLPVIEWTDSHVVFVDESPTCVRYTYTINVATKSVTGVRQPKTVANGAGLGCDELKSELRLTMRSGFDVWYPLDQAALPWYGRIALAPFELLR
jgi:hypothetical protein